MHNSLFRNYCTSSSRIRFYTQNITAQHQDVPCLREEGYFDHMHKMASYAVQDGILSNTRWHLVQ